MRPIVGYVPGVFDMFHIGHLTLLRRAANECDFLIAGVVSDERVTVVKGHPPRMSLDERMTVMRAIGIVDRVVIDDSTDKAQMWDRLHFDVLFKGDDWQGTPRGVRLEASMAAVGARVRYFPYTTRQSSTRIRTELERQSLGPVDWSPLG